MQENSTHQGQGQIKVPMKQGDWMCPECNFLNFARNIRCLRCDRLFQERLRKLGEDQDRLPLKKGDWICDTCNFLNFAKNTTCLLCKEKPPKRQLNPGEWECESCNYINFRRNMVCLKCDHRRPKAANFADNPVQPQHEDRQTGNRGVNRWRFVEDESRDHDGSNLGNGVPGFEDFPIAGGKSELSRNAQKQERWKMEMAERSRKASPISNKRLQAAENKKTETEVPPWLKVMYAMVYFDTCIAHSNNKKNDLDRFCIDCVQSFCYNCLPAHGLHKYVKIRRYVYCEVINRQDLCRLFDCSGIQVSAVHRDEHKEETTGDHDNLRIDKKGENLKRDLTPPLPKRQKVRKGIALRAPMF
ncbi:hypothetical protein F0562_033504 [Nyssa sinensis]|uniref:RanBP2-type domain-containing protein n=1 Tax=Nyssa sinensis TaxID=561372 RepID=A0A5J5AFM2_9ASTE|nr:hypothetical protein F0562_033504 [Nyssa sinensis]